MAILDDSDQKDKMSQDQTSPNQPGQSGASAQSGQAAPAAGSLSTSGTAGGTISGSSGGNSAGVGAGGTGGWTNIQSYLNANQNNQGSANLLNSTVGGQFDNEKQNIQSQVDTNKKSIDDYNSATNLNPDKASQILQDASKNYNFDGKQSDAYNQGVGQLKNFQTATYGAPTNFQYGTSAQAQQYGTALASDQGFSGMMNHIYSNAAGSGLSSGQQALQSQFDTQNPALAQSRGDLLTKFAGLGDFTNQAVTDTNNYAQAGQQDFLKNQGDLKSYLANQQALDTQSIGQLASQFSGYKSQFDPQVQALKDQIASYTAAYQKEAPNLAADISSPSATEDYTHTNANTIAANYAQLPALNTKLGDLQNNELSQLNDYTTRENNSKSDWNTIADVLGSAGPKLNQSAPQSSLTRTNSPGSIIGRPKL